MKCPNCGNEVVEGLVICTNCGSTINSTIQTGNDANKQIISTHSKTNEKSISEKIEQKHDKVSFWICLISFIPLVGIIYFFVNKNVYPKKSKAAIICAAIGFVLPYVITFVFEIIYNILK